MTQDKLIRVLTLAIPQNLAEEALQLLDDREVERVANQIGELQEVTAQALIPIHDDKSEAVLVEFGNRAKVAWEELERVRRERVAPLIAEKKAVDDLFKAVQSKLEPLFAKNGEAERIIIAYRIEKKAKQQREKEEADRKAREAAEEEARARARLEAAKTPKAREKAMAAVEEASQKQTAAVLAMPFQVRGVRTDTGLVSDREVWTLTSFSDLKQVPERYWHDPIVVKALEMVVGKAVRAGEHNIPGCVIEPLQGLRRTLG